MTETDVRVVEQNAHFTHFLYDLLRTIEEGVPVVSFVEMDTIVTGTDKVEKRIAEELYRLCKRHREHVRCNYTMGQKIRCKKGYDEVLNMVFTVADEVKVMDDGRKYDACVLVSEKFSNTPIVVPTDTINENYELYEESKNPTD